MKTIAILFSDLHLGEYAKFNQNNQRTLNHFKVLSVIKKACIENRCPAIFAGDLFHRPEVLTNAFYETLIEEFKVLDESPWSLYAISGNHDCSLSNKIDKLSPSWVRTLSKQFNFLKCFDLQTRYLSKFDLTGVPYLDHNIGLNEYVKNIKVDPKRPHILVLHTDYPGAKDTNDIEIDTVENLNINLLNKFSLTIIGHIHKPQRLSKKVYMIGAPLQQRRTDKNCDLGYWELKEDLSMEFVSLSDEFPKFIDISNEDEKKDDGNYYTLTLSKETAGKSSICNHGISKNLGSTKMARKYLRMKSIKDKQKKKALIKILKEVENDTI